MNPSLETMVGDALRGVESAEPHPDAVTLAAYLDRVLAAPETARVEAHLAICGTCRALVSEASRPTWLAPRSRLRVWQGWLAAAAVLTLLWIGLWTVRSRILPVLPTSTPSGPSVDGRWASLGLDPAWFEDNDRRLLALIRSAFEGDVAVRGDFAPFVGGQRDGALRGASDHRAAQPISPRWSAVRARRPVFRWHTPLGSADGGEILLVDDTEHLVATLGFEGGVATGPISSLAFPEILPPLEPGRLYAWKVNTRGDDGMVASDYVPFRVLTVDEDRAIAARVAPIDVKPYAAAVALAEAGLHTEALARLATDPGTSAGRRLHGALARAILAEQRLPEALIRGEAERLGLLVGEVAP